MLTSSSHLYSHDSDTNKYAACYCSCGLLLKSDFYILSPVPNPVFRGNERRADETYCAVRNGVNKKEHLLVAQSSEPPPPHNFEIK